MVTGKFPGKIDEILGLPCDEVASHPGEGKAVWATRLRKRLFFFSPYFFEVPLLKYNLPLKIISLGVYYLD